MVIPPGVSMISAALVLAFAASARAQEPAPAPPPPPAAPVVGGAHHHLLHPHPPFFGEATYRSPGLAVALSLTPLPVDFGNLYAENLGWGIAYTAIELSLAAPMMWLAGNHMGHAGWNDGRRWSDGEAGAMIGLAAGYVAVKLVAGFHAGSAARAFNEAYAARRAAFAAAYAARRAAFAAGLPVR